MFLAVLCAQGENMVNLDWARGLRDQCIKHDVPFFFKQESAARPGANPMLDRVEWHQFPKVEK